MPEKLDKSSRIPLPQQLKAILRKRIETGHYKPGERIDAVRKRAEEFNVSSLTVQKACKLLEKENCIISMPQSGLFVPENFFERPARTMKIAFVFPEVEISPRVLDMENWGMTNELNRGLLAGAQEHNVKLDFMHIAWNGGFRERFQYVSSIRENYDCAIFFGNQLMDVQLELSAHSFPVYTVCNYPSDVSSKLISVYYDQDRAMELIVEAALNSGSEKFAVFSSTQDFYPANPNVRVMDKETNQEICSSRSSFFLKLCKKYGVERSRIDYQIFDENNRNKIPALLRELRGAFIFCNNAYLVRDIYVAAYENGMIPGKDFQIMAIASGVTFMGLIPSLSYVRVPMYELGLQLLRTAYSKFIDPEKTLVWDPVMPELIQNETSIHYNKNKECI